MPRKARGEQRIYWHIAHAEQCGCRLIPPKVREEVERKARGKAEGVTSRTGCFLRPETASRCLDGFLMEM
jgi:hypothetical protein